MPTNSRSYKILNEFTEAKLESFYYDGIPNFAEMWFTVKESQGNRFDDLIMLLSYMNENLSQTAGNFCINQTILNINLGPLVK